MSFLIKNDKVQDKYDKIWDVIKDKLGIKFHSKPVYEYKYLEAKVRKLDGVIKKIFLGNDMPKENIHYTCIACITIDSVLRINKKMIRKFIQRSVNIGQKIQTSRFINTELKSDSELSDSESYSEKIGAKVNKELMAKLEKSGPDQQ